MDEVNKRPYSAVIKDVRKILDQRSPSSSSTCVGSQLDFEGFRRRLESFTSFNVVKSLDFNPIHAAAYGWEATPRGALKCVSCQEIWRISLPQDTNSSTYLDALKSVTENINDAKHKKCCLWSSCPCPPSFWRVSRKHISKYHVEAAAERMLASEGPAEVPLLAAKCEEAVLAQVDDIETAKSRLDDFSAVIQKKLGTEPDQAKAAVLLSLSGWTPNFDSTCQLSSLCCEYCFRYIDVDSSKRSKNTDNQGFHVLEEHRSWCPWIAASSAYFEKPGEMDKQPGFVMAVEQVLAPRGKDLSEDVMKVLKCL